MRHVLKARRADFAPFLAPEVVLTWLFDIDPCTDVKLDASADDFERQFDVVARVLAEQQGDFD